VTSRTARGATEDGEGSGEEGERRCWGPHDRSGGGDEREGEGASGTEGFRIGG
jgi:hypothetical protein